MKARFLLLAAAAMTLTITACQQTSEVEPQAGSRSNHGQRVGADNPTAAASDSNGSDRTKAPWWPLSDAQVQAMFNTIDLDHSGQLSYTEMQAALVKLNYKPTISDAKQLIKQWDRNNSGMMEFNEFQYMMAAALKNDGWKKLL